MPIFSKQTFEGYLEINHRDSPGFTPEEARAAGVPHVGAGEVLKTATRKCNHCEAMVVLNPRRTRDRGYCWKGDHYLCDLCAAEYHRTGVCKDFNRQIDEFLNKVAKGA